MLHGNIDRERLIRLECHQPYFASGTAALAAAFAARILTLPTHRRADRAGVPFTADGA